MNPFLLQVQSEMIFGVLFVLWGIICIIFNKRSGTMYAAFQKGWGLEKSAFSVGRLISIAGGILAIILGLMMLFVRRT